MLTIPRDDWEPVLPDACSYVKGQGEIGESGYRHWQILAIFKRSVRTAAVMSAFVPCHAEPTRSAAAEQYVWKDDTAEIATRFEIGEKPHKRNSRTDWQLVWDAAVAGNLLAIEPGVRIQYYRTLRAIGQDFAKPTRQNRSAIVYWGPTGTGKSHRAWAEAGDDAFGKDPRTKWFDGHHGQENIVCDEFRGGIDISHILRWLDKYPLRSEHKGYSKPNNSCKWWFTSNLHPKDWYPDLDENTWKALERRLYIEELTVPYVE